MEQYTCKQVAKMLNCSGKTVRKWAGILFEKQFYMWLFSPEQIEELRQHIHDGGGRPKNLISV